MGYRIISKPGCPFCTQAKQLLDIKGHAYEEDLRDTPEGIEAFKTAGFRTFPQIWVEEEGTRLTRNKPWIHIGGFDQLRQHLANLEDDF